MNMIDGINDYHHLSLFFYQFLLYKLDNQEFNFII